MSIHWNALKEKMEIFDIMPRYISIYMHMEIQISQSVVKIDKYSLSNNCWKATKNWAMHISITPHNLFPFQPSAINIQQSAEYQYV